MDVYRQLFYINLLFTCFFIVYTEGYVFETNRSNVFPETRLVPSRSAVLLCRNHADLLLNGLENNAKWAMEMWDSAAKSPTGWLFGNQAQLGNFDECQNVKAPYSLKFCVGKVHFSHIAQGEKKTKDTVWTSIHESVTDRSMVSRASIFWGLCVPASCPAAEFQAVYTNHAVNFTFSLEEDFCTDFRSRNTGGYGEVIFWCVTVILMGITAAATCIDLFRESVDVSKNNEALARKLLHCFSLRRNFPKLVAYNPATAEHPLAIFHGLRFASVVFVLYAHRTGIPISFSAQNHHIWESHLQHLGFKFVAQTDMTVDTFFFISGVLLSFFLLKKSFNPVAVVLSRIFRLMPLYLWVIFFEAFAMPRLGSGPLWQIVQGSESAKCAENWWLSALFLQNYIKDSDMCMTHTWYIPCEMHFFLVSLLVLIVLNYKRSAGLFLLVALCAAFIVVPGVVVFWQNLDPLVLFYFPDFLENPRTNKTFLEVYVKSHNRAAVYLIGLLTGYYLLTVENKARKPDQKRSLGLLALSLILMGLPLVYGVHFYSPNDTPSPMEKGIFAALRRPIWALGLFCLVLSNLWGPIPFLSRILSSRAAVVLGRISYGLYLLHFPIITANLAKMRQAPVFNWFDVIFSGDLASTCIFAAILYVVIEVPIRDFFTSLLLHNSKKENIKTPDMESSRV